MMTELNTTALLVFMLIFTRWLVLTSMIPFLGAMLLPSMTRIALAASLSVVSFVVIFEQQVIITEINYLIICLLFLKEALIGFILGFLISIIFFTYEIFGQLVDLVRAASMAQILVPEFRQASSPMGSFLFQISLVIFISLGLHREVIYNLAQSFKKFPVLEYNNQISQILTIEIIQQVLVELISLAASFAMPVIFVCFIVDLAFGLLNRVAPQINAYFLSLPTKIISGLIILFFLLPILAHDFPENYNKINNIFFDLYFKNTNN